MKIQRTKYGGFGYGHILNNVRSMLEHDGMTDAEFRTITEENPRRMFTFDAPED